MSTYDPILYSWNGPEMLTRVVLKLCNKTDVHDITPQNCGGLNVLPRKSCFNLNYNEWRLFFDQARTSEVMQRLKDSYIVHYWSSLSKKLEKFPSNVSNAFTEYAKVLCPKVMQHVGEFIP